MPGPRWALRPGNWPFRWTVLRRKIDVSFMTHAVEVGQGNHSMQNQDNLADTLKDWSRGVSSCMRGTRYGRWAEDIGQEFALMWLQSYRASTPIPKWSGSFDKQSYRKAMMIAKPLTPPTVPLDERCVPYAERHEPASLTSEREIRHIERLKKEFSMPDINRLLRCCAATDRPTQRALAKSAHVPERSFKRTIHQLRDSGHEP
jgi:hypothetical protein